MTACAAPAPRGKCAGILMLWTSTSPRNKNVAPLCGRANGRQPSLRHTSWHALITFGGNAESGRSTSTFSFWVGHGCATRNLYLIFQAILFLCGERAEIMAARQDHTGVRRFTP